MSWKPFKPVRSAVIVPLVVLLAAFSGCGGGGSSSSADSGGGPPPAVDTALPARTLNWEPPGSYTDGTPMNPLSDLDRFEVYVNETGTFAGSEVPKAVLSAVDPGTRQLTTSFNLANIATLSRGPRYWVSLRAVALTGMKSDFSPPASFSF
jgi:hypothetical protein